MGEEMVESCLKCGSKDRTKDGVIRGLQRYKCRLWL